MNEISFWQLEPIAKKRSIQGEYLFMREFFFLSIHVKNEFSNHKACMGKDQNNDFSHGQLDHNVGISQSAMNVEEKNL